MYSPAQIPLKRLKGTCMYTHSSFQCVSLTGTSHLHKPTLTPLDHSLKTRNIIPTILDWQAETLKELQIGEARWDLMCKRQWSWKRGLSSVAIGGPKCGVKRKEEKMVQWMTNELVSGNLIFQFLKTLYTRRPFLICSTFVLGSSGTPSPQQKESHCF